MKKMLLFVGLLTAVLTTAALQGNAQQSLPSAGMALTPSEMTWTHGNMALPGMEQLNLVGDPTKAGPYTVRLKFPAGYKLAAHTHPDSREVTILSGTWYMGYGEKADPEKLKAMTAGSFFTEPANVAHFIEIREPTVVQVSGNGPSGRKFVSPVDTATAK
jgi:quercetin dioxygenase-like cupin family protein